MPQTRSGLALFRNFLQQYRQLILVAVGAGAVPLVAGLASLTPAWPSGIAFVTAVAQLVVLALVFQLLRSASPSGSESRSWYGVRRPMWPADGLFRSIVPVHIHRARLKGALHQRICLYVGSAGRFRQRMPASRINQLRQAEFEEELVWTLFHVLHELVDLDRAGSVFRATTALG